MKCSVSGSLGCFRHPAVEGLLVVGNPLLAEFLQRAVGIVLVESSLPFGPCRRRPAHDVDQLSHRRIGGDKIIVRTGHPVPRAGRHAARILTAGTADKTMDEMTVLGDDIGRQRIEGNGQPYRIGPRLQLIDDPGRGPCIYKDRLSTRQPGKGLREKNFVLGAMALDGVGQAEFLDLVVDHIAAPSARIAIDHIRLAVAVGIEQGGDLGECSVRVLGHERGAGGGLDVVGAQDHQRGVAVGQLGAVARVGKEGQLTSVELKMKPGAQAAAIKNELRRLLGDGVKVEDRFEQNKTLYLVMRGEKWAVYAILLLVLLIASFNMIGSLSMVVLEKKKDMVILKSMGATQGLVQRIFLFEGCCLALVGGVLGIGSGLLLCLGQQYFGWVGLPDGFIISAYPVELRLADFALVAGTVIAVGVLAAWYPARKAALQPLVLREE